MGHKPLPADAPDFHQRRLGQCYLTASGYVDAMDSQGFSAKGQGAVRQTCPDAVAKCFGPAARKPVHAARVRLHRLGGACGARGVSASAPNLQYATLNDNAHSTEVFRSRRA
eukprot:scaffold2520_cov324-Prasinococcus_capsulatus_cf.AAC.3